MEEPKSPEISLPTPRKKTISLAELGSRFTLKLVRIEEDICSGRVLYHKHVKKSSAEIKTLEQRHTVKMKEQRTKEQEESIVNKDC